MRRPLFTLSLIGIPEAGDGLVVSGHADDLIEAMRASSGELVYLEAGEPVHVPTSDGRPMLEIAVSTITT